MSRAAEVAERNADEAYAEEGAWGSTAAEHPYMAMASFAVAGPCFAAPAEVVDAQVTAVAFAVAIAVALVMTNAAVGAVVVAVEVWNGALAGP